jgi:hypothetical protein
MVTVHHNDYKIFFPAEYVRHIDHRRWLPVPSIAEALRYFAPVGEVRQWRERVRSAVVKGELEPVDLFGLPVWEGHIASGLFRVPG